MPDKIKTAIGANTPGSILVATQRLHILHAVKKSFANSVQEIYWAANGATVLQLVKSNTIQILILDGDLQNPAAQDLVTQIRMNPQHDLMRIVFCGDSRKIQSFEPFLLEHDRVFDSF